MIMIVFGIFILIEWRILNLYCMGFLKMVLLIGWWYVVVLNKVWYLRWYWNVNVEYVYLIFFFVENEGCFFEGGWFECYFDWLGWWVFIFIYLGYS